MLGAPPPIPRDLPHSRQNGEFLGADFAAPAIPAAESALELRLRRALIVAPKERR